MDYQEPYLILSEIVPNYELVSFSKLQGDYYVGTSSTDIIIFHFDDVLSEICRKSFSGTDIKCFNGRIYASKVGRVDILDFSPENECLELLHSTKLEEDMNSPRYGVGHKIVVCEKGIITSAIQENFSIFPVNDFGSIVLIGKFKIHIPNSVIWSFDIVGKEPNSQNFYIALLTSNPKKKCNEIRLLKTDFASTKKLRIYSPIETDNIFTKIVTTPKRNNIFLCQREESISIFRITFEEDLEEIGSVKLTENISTMITTMGWFGSGKKHERLLASCDNGDIFSISGIGTPDLQKKKIGMNMSVCRLIMELEENDDDDDEEEEEEEENDDDDDDEITSHIFCIFEKSKPIIYELKFPEFDFSKVYALPSVFPILDFGVNQKKKEFLVGSGSHLSHIQLGIHCGIIFQTPPDSYPGISRMMITKNSVDRDSVDSLIFLSCGQVSSTNILKISNDSEILPLENNNNNNSFETNDETIHVNCIGENLILQVTTKKAILVEKQETKKPEKIEDEEEEEEGEDNEEEEDEEEDNDFWKLISFWNSNEKITHASVSQEVCVIGSNSNHIQLLEIKRNKNTSVSLRSETWVDGAEEITCISKFDTNYFAVGLFSGNIHIYDLQTLVVKGKISLSEAIPEYSQESCCVESIVMECVPNQPNSVIIYSGLRNGWVVIQEMFITENESVMIQRSYVEKIGVEPVELVKCSNLPFQVAAVTSRVLMIQVGPSLISVLPLGLERNNISKMVPLFTNDHRNTILTVSKDERLEIWKMSPTAKFISTDYLENEKCYRVYYLEFLDCYIYFSQNNSSGVCSIGVFYEEDESIQYCHSLLFQFPKNEIPYGFYEWREEEEEEEELQQQPQKIIKNNENKLIDEEEEEEEEEEEPMKDENYETSVVVSNFKKQNLVIGTSKNNVYYFDIGENREQMSRKRIFGMKLLKLIDISKISEISKKSSKDKKKMKDEEQEGEGEEDEEQEENENLKFENNNNNNNIVYAISRYQNKYFIISSSENLYLVDLNFRLLSKSNVRHFVYSIECKSSKKTLQQNKDQNNNNNNSNTIFDEDENIYVTDQYDSIIVLRIEEHSETFLYIQSDQKTRTNVVPKIFDFYKNSENDNVLVGTDRSSKELFTIKFQEDELERKIIESQQTQNENKNNNKDNKNNNKNESTIVKNIKHSFNEMKLLSNIFLEDVPVRVKVWRTSEIDSEIIIGALISGKIFQISVVDKNRYLVLQKLQFILERIESLEIMDWISELLKNQKKKKEKKEKMNDEEIEEIEEEEEDGFNNNNELMNFQKFFNLEEVMKYQPILGSTNLKKQRRGRFDNSQIIINKEFLNLFLEFSEDMKLFITNSINLIFGSEFMDDVTVEKIMSAIMSL